MRLRRSSNAIPSDRSKPRMRSGKWKGTAAALMIEAILLTPLSGCGEPSERFAYSSAAKPAFDAWRNPRLRQAYLDGKAEGWKNECVAAIVYDPEVEEAEKECQRIVRKYSADPAGCSSEKLYYTMTTSGMVIGMIEVIGRKQKMNIYVLPRAFLLGGEWISGILLPHESTHACDIYHGVKVGEKTFTHKEFSIYPYLLIPIIEVRATGNILKRTTPEQWEDPETAWGILTQAQNFHFYLMELESYEEALPKENEITDEINKNKAYLIRKTLAEYKDVAEMLDEFIKKHRDDSEEW